jgi:hypothetical protein
VSLMCMLYMVVCNQLVCCWMQRLQHLQGHESGTNRSSPNCNTCWAKKLAHALMINPRTVLQIKLYLDAVPACAAVLLQARDGVTLPPLPGAPQALLPPNPKTRRPWVSGLRFSVMAYALYLPATLSRVLNGR